MIIFLICSQLMRDPLIELFHLSKLLQLLNQCRIVTTEFSSNFSCSCQRISFNSCPQLVVVNVQWPATTLLIFKALISFAKFLEPPLHSMSLSSSWAKCIVDVSSCLHYFMTLLNSNKISWNCFFSNITSLTLKYFPGGSDGKSICLQSEIPRFDPWVGKILWRRIWQPTPVFLAGKSHGWRSLAGYSPWGCKESDMTEQLHNKSLAKNIKWEMHIKMMYNITTFI